MENKNTVEDKKPVQAEQKKPEKTEASSKSNEWCDEEIKLLIKGAQVIPAGTRERSSFKNLN